MNSITISTPKMTAPSTSVREFCAYPSTEWPILWSITGPSEAACQERWGNVIFSRWEPSGRNRLIPHGNTLANMTDGWIRRIAAARLHEDSQTKSHAGFLKFRRTVSYPLRIRQRVLS
jgi:hypothetical protein